MRYDYVFVGGGLASGLCVLALLEQSPALRIAVVERDATLGGNHTWCFHARDVPVAERAWLAPLIVREWQAYHVRFPRRTRRVCSGYGCVTSQRLHEVLEALAARSNLELFVGSDARRVLGDRVELADGRALQAIRVVDARGPRASARGPSQGYQKFVGLELRVTAGPHGPAQEPLVMDACLPQHDGFRFMYSLPFAADRWLFEETFFSDDAALNVPQSRERILQYARALHFEVHEVLREEQGVLPMPWQHEALAGERGVRAAGYRGGLFHPVTGYSFPMAVRFASALAKSHPDTDAEESALQRFLAQHREQRPFLFLLTRMMFGLFEPERRFEVLEHFYRLPESVIERFYAAELSPLDRARMFLGAPPRGISFKRALGIVRNLHTEQTP